MLLSKPDITTLIVLSALVLLAALLTAVLSVISGVTLAFRARPSWFYGIALAALFLPFASGSSVWAFSVSRFSDWIGLKSGLVASGTLERASALLILSLARSVPLGTFFCATFLHRYVSEFRAYVQVHALRFPLLLLCGVNRIPRSIVTLLGLFGGALLAAEASLPMFLYRANPGTGPETANIMLARLFREVYATSGSRSIGEVASLGVIVAVVLVIAALAGLWTARGVLHVWRSLLRFTGGLPEWKDRAILFTAVVPLILTFLPSIICIIGLTTHIPSGNMRALGIVESIASYWGIVTSGVVIGSVITVCGIALAVRFRYSRRDYLFIIERKSLAACLLMLPAFLPVLSIVALVGAITHGGLAGLPGYISLFCCQIALHYSLFQFVTASVISAVPEPRVAWQRSLRMRYSFSLLTDGLKRHASAVVALIGLGAVQVITDGSISRWFNHLVASPEEAMYSALFGRLSSASRAMIIARTVLGGAILMCGVLSAFYVRELKRESRHA